MKLSGKEIEIFEGPAIVFDGEMAAFEAIQQNKVPPTPPRPLTPPPQPLSLLKPSAAAQGALTLTPAP
eukprot:6836033-Prymnesium_polylepis.1